MRLRFIATVTLAFTSAAFATAPMLPVSPHVLANARSAY